MRPAPRHLLPGLASIVVIVASLLPLGEQGAQPRGDGAPVTPVEAAGVLDVVDAATAAGVGLLGDGAGCGGLLELVVGDGVLCTHGEDEFAPAEGVGNSPGSPVPSRAPACIDGGTTGQRVEVLYVHRTGTSGISSSLRRDVARWVGQVEWTIGRSAERFGGKRQVRWLTDGGCNVVVRSTTASGAAMDDIRTMITELRDAGHDAADRTYLLFVDDDRYCGIATAPRDDSAVDNRSARTPGYARVDRPCWDTGDRGFHSIAAHELVHTLGAVQESAPNATPASHCTDEHDLLCYDDGSGGLRAVCSDDDDATSGAGDDNDRLLDCNGDDYFHPAPPSGSYLAQHWNVANHPRLHDPRLTTSQASTGSFGIGITALRDDLRS